MPSYSFTNNTILLENNLPINHAIGMTTQETFVLPATIEYRFKGTTFGNTTNFGTYLQIWLLPEQDSSVENTHFSFGANRNIYTNISRYVWITSNNWNLENATFEEEVFYTWTVSLISNNYSLEVRDDLGNIVYQKTDAHPFNDGEILRLGISQDLGNYGGASGTWPISAELDYIRVEY